MLKSTVLMAVATSTLMVAAPGMVQTSAATSAYTQREEDYAYKAMSAPGMYDPSAIAPRRAATPYTGPYMVLPEEKPSMSAPASTPGRDREY